MGDLYRSRKDQTVDDSFVIDESFEMDENSSSSHSNSSEQVNRIRDSDEDEIDENELDVDDTDEEIEAATSKRRPLIGTASKSFVATEERLTPIIRKAIRRSIHQFSLDSSDEELEKKDPIVIPESDCESDEDIEPKNNSKASINRKSDSEIEIVDNSLMDRSMSPLQKVDKRKKNTRLVEISDESSDEDKENDPGNTERDEFALSMACTEARNSMIDPVAAQKRALLRIEKQRIEQSLAKKKQIYKTANLANLPDNGERLRMTIAEDEEEIERIIDKLRKIESTEEPAKPNKPPEMKKSLFKEGSLEINSSYLKPTETEEEKDLGKKALKTFEREQALTVERLQDLHSALLAKPADDQLAEDPKGLKIPLMPHQKYALTWLQWREKKKPRGGLLADDMGLGKTLTMISLIIAAKAQKADEDESDGEEWISTKRPQKFNGGTLVVAPASLVGQWASEVKDRCRRDLLKIELHHGNNRESNASKLSRKDLVITTYNLLSRDFKTNGVLFKIRWNRIILDEAHVIRNHKSQTCEAVCGLNAEKRWVLTGTPVQNKEMDLFAILKFLHCSPFDDVRVWKRWVDNKSSTGHERLATVMKTIMLRRTKKDLQDKGALQSLPDKKIEEIVVTLDSDERLVYDKVMMYSRTIFAQYLYRRAEKNAFQNDFVVMPTTSTSNLAQSEFTKAQKKLLSLHADVEQHEILVLLLRLRQICCHPSLITAMLDRDDIEQDGLDVDAHSEDDLLSKLHDLTIDEEEIGVDKRVVGNLLTSDNPVFDKKRRSSKIRAIIDKVEEIISHKDKVIIVSQWRTVLDIVAGELNSNEKISYKMFTGQVAVKNRQEIVEKLNDPRSKVNVLLLSLTAGGVGLNLVGANHLMLIDIHWNPQLECQAQDRIYRFGQKKDVFIYKYICTDTIEERIKDLQERKMQIAESLLGGSGAVASAKLTLDDMKSLFGM